MLFRMEGILFGLFVWNSNGELRRTTTISSPSWNSRITAIFTVLEQQICIWMHNCYLYFENSGYSAIPSPSKHTPINQARGSCAALMEITHMKHLTAVNRHRIGFFKAGPNRSGKDQI
jgi:hypothetical protein